MKKLRTALVMLLAAAALITWSAILPVVGLLYIFGFMHA
jgi:hypothetical protein